MIKATLFFFSLFCISPIYGQSTLDSKIPSNPTYADHLLHIYLVSQDLNTKTTRIQLQERLYKVVNLYNTWASAKEVGKHYSDLLFYLVIDLHEREHPRYSFYYEHCVEAESRGEVDEEVCEVLGLMRK